MIRTSSREASSRRARARVTVALAALVFVVPVGLGAVEGVARAEQPAPGDAAASSEDAGAHFERGVGFFRDGDYTAAMVEFKKAYELDPRYPVLFNLGQTSKELKDYAAALTSFERYLSEGGDKIDPDRKKTVQGWIDELKGKVGRVKLQVNVEGADVVVDDIAIGKTPLDKPIVMNAGRRKVAISKEGYAPLTRFVDVAGTEAKDLSLNLVSLAAPPGGGGHGPPSGGGAPREEPSSPVAPGQWVMFSITAATGVAAGVVGGLALGKKGDFDDALKKVPTTSTEIEDARKSAKTFALAADVLTGVTAAAAVTTVVLFIVDASAGGPTDDAKPEAPKPTARIVVGPTFAGVTGSF